MFPVRVVYKTKLRSDGLVDKLKVRIAIRGDLDTGAKDEDNAALSFTHYNRPTYSLYSTTGEAVGPPVQQRFPTTPHSGH